MMTTIDCSSTQLSTSIEITNMHEIPVVSLIKEQQANMSAHDQCNHLSLCQCGHDTLQYTIHHKIWQGHIFYHRNILLSTFVVTLYNALPVNMSNLKKSCLNSPIALTWIWFNHCRFIK